MVSCISRTLDFWLKISAKVAAYTRVFTVILLAHCEYITKMGIREFYVKKFKIDCICVQYASQRDM